MSYGILIIEDEAILAKKIAKYLTQSGFVAQVAGNGQDGLNILDTFLPDVVLLDYNLPGGLNGLEVLEHIRMHNSDIKVIMFTGAGNIRLAVDAMKAGAFDYLSKPISLSGLKILLDRAIGQDRRESQLSYYRAKQVAEGGVGQIIGKCAKINHVKSQIGQIIKASQRLNKGTAPAILITGETGTGKELVARALHFGGSRSKEPFIEVNVATIPSHLVESELFGHERGAFTGAHERKLGLVEAADGGTLFLDEIGELDLAVQAKLLKLLEDQKMRRLGSVRSRHVDLQILSATNRPLKNMVEQGTFRADLFFRLNTLTLDVPPLRERDADILILSRYFLRRFGKKYSKPGLTLSDNANAAIMNYHWPGNVRELRNTIEQSVLLCDGREISGDQFSFLKEENMESGPPPPHSTRLQQPAGESASGTTLHEVERDLIERTLREVDGNVSKSARRLGISRDQLRYRIEKYGIDSKY